MAQESIFVKMLLPQKPFEVKEVRSVEIPAVEGPYLVLPRRAPAMKLLKNGTVVLRDAEDPNKVEKYFITSGIAKIRDDACTIITREVMDVATTDINEIKKRLAVFTCMKDRDEHLDAVEREKEAFLQMIVGYFEK